MKVLIAIDDSPFSRHVLESVKRRRWHPGTQFKVLTVVESLGASCEHTLESDEETTGLDIRRKRQQKATELCEAAKHSLDGIPEAIIHFEIRKGKVASEVVKAATEWEADRIIVGAHGHTVCPHNLTSSVSRAVGEHARCAVEVVRP